MPHPSHEIVALAPQTVTGTVTGDDIIIVEQFTAAIFKLKSDAGTGTSPTLDVYVQQKLPTAGASDTSLIQPTGTALYDDYAAFTQITTSASTQILRIVGGGGQGTSQPTAASDAALTAGTVRNGPIGRAFRIKTKAGGTSPSFANVQLTVQLIP